MKRLLLCFVILAVAGCSSMGIDDVQIHDIKNIKMGQSAGFGGLNEKQLIDLDETKAQLLLEIWQQTKPVNNATGYTKPDYDLLFLYSSNMTQGLHVFLDSSNKKGAFMFIGHENTVYQVPQQKVEQLRNIVHERKK